jgi:hypothetical protein
MITLYDIARQKAGTAQLNWVDNACTASILAESYIPNFAADTHISVAGVRYADISVVRKLVASTGWWTCDPIVFLPAVLPGPVSQVTVWRNSDSAPIFHCKFPVLPPSATPRPFALLFSISKPGILRL